MYLVWTLCAMVSFQLSLSHSHSPSLLEFVVCCVGFLHSEWMRINFHIPHSLSGIYEIAFTLLGWIRKLHSFYYYSTSDEIESSLSWAEQGWASRCIVVAAVILRYVLIHRTNFMSNHIIYLMLKYIGPLIMMTR